MLLLLNHDVTIAFRDADDGDIASNDDDDYDDDVATAKLIAKCQ